MGKDLMDKYMSMKIEELPESKKSEFVGKLIGLGVLKKEGDKLEKEAEEEMEEEALRRSGER